MDARVEAGAMTIGVETPVVEVRTSEKVDLPVAMLVSLFDAASALAPLLDQGNSLTAVAPDHILGRKVSALAAIAA
jgi:hypothetical protein